MTATDGGSRGGIRKRLVLFGLVVLLPFTLSFRVLVRGAKVAFCGLVLILDGSVCNI